MLACCQQKKQGETDDRTYYFRNILLPPLLINVFRNVTWCTYSVSYKYVQQTTFFVSPGRCVVFFFVVSCLTKNSTITIKVTGAMGESTWMGTIEAPCTKKSVSPHHEVSYIVATRVCVICTWFCSARACSRHVDSTVGVTTTISSPCALKLSQRHRRASFFFFSRKGGDRYPTFPAAGTHTHTFSSTPSFNLFYFCGS